jgi:hypothetical protein
MIRFLGSILRAASIACPLSTHRRSSALQSFGLNSGRKHRDAETRWTNLSQVEQLAEYREYVGFGKEFEKANRSSNALEPTSAAKSMLVARGAARAISK